MSQNAFSPTIFRRMVLFMILIAGLTSIIGTGGGSSSKKSNDNGIQTEMHKMLVSAAWVDQLIKGGNPGKAGTPSDYPGNGYIIIDLDNWAGGYDAGHVPGAIAMSWWELNKEETKNPTTPDGGNLKAPAEMRAKLEEVGINYNTTVVICSKWATLYGRVAWALMCLGIEDVRVLHGGLTAWTANGGAVETTINPRSPITYTGTIPDPVVSKYNATTGDMVAYMNDPDGSIMLDTRTWDEFIGADDYHSYISKPGRVPGSLYYPYLNMIAGGVDGEDAMLRNFDDVRSDLEALGVTDDKTMAFICTIGQRSGFACWYAYMMGYTDVKNWDAGWFDWIADPTRPIETGVPNNYPNGHLLAEARDLLSSKAVILDARSAEAYNAGHIPNAVNLRWQDFVDAANMLLPVRELEELLGEAGLTRASRIIIYDDTTASRGAAGRVFWMLESLGCSQVSILNGGWDKWIAAGNQPEAAPHILSAKTFTADRNPDATSTKANISGRMDDNDFVIVDTRTDEEYNGWTLYGEARGGHITGAVHIPYEWSFQSDKTLWPYDQLKEIFESRGVTQAKEVAAYGTDGVRSGFAYFLCRLMGYQRVSNYDGSIMDWAAASVDCSACYPMDQMANYQALVYPEWVDQLIHEENPPTYPGNGYVIVFTSWWPRWETNEISTTGAGTPFDTDGHIPGAIFLDTYSIETGPGSEYGDGYASPSESYVKALPDLQAFFASMGITKDTTVVVYADDDITPMTAGRIAWGLMYAGVVDVRILNGGYNAWVAGGFPVETGPTAWTPVAAFGESAGNLELLATTEDVKNVIAGTDPDAVVVDDRSWEEFIGETNSYYWWFEEYGRIPTAKWIGDWDAIARARDGYQSFITYTQAASNWEELGFSPDKKMYFYCGGGARSAQYTFYAYLLGWPAANYEGGWFLWSSDPENDRETGLPE